MNIHLIYTIYVKSLFNKSFTPKQNYPVRWGYRIHRLNLCREIRCVLDMTQNNLMAKFRVPLHCHPSQVHSGPEW